MLSVRALSSVPKPDTDRACLAALSGRQTSHLYLSRFLPNLFLSLWPLFHESVINHFLDAGPVCTECFHKGSGTGIRYTDQIAIK